jgi:hypothetical protein
VDVPADFGERKKSERAQHDDGNQLSPVGACVNGFHARVQCTIRALST